MRSAQARVGFCSILVFLILLSACREVREIPTSSTSLEGSSNSQSSTDSSGFIVARFITSTEDSSTLTWYDSDTTRTAYFVERQDADSAQFVTLAILDPQRKEYSDGGLKRVLHIYSYRVAAVKGASEKQYSNIVRLYLNPRRPLSVRPIHESTSSVTLQWNFTGNICTGFLVQRSLDGNAYTSLGTTTENQLEYTDRGLDTTRLYYYRVFTLTKYDVGPSSLPIRIGYIFNPMYQQPIWMQVLFSD